MNTTFRCPLSPEPSNTGSTGRNLIVAVGPNRLCLIKTAALCTGYTAKAIYRKIEEGIWVEGVHWRKAPDGHIFIDLNGVNAWIERAVRR